MDKTTDYGRPMKPFFNKTQNFWAWTDKLGRQILGHLGYLQPNYTQVSESISTKFGTVSLLSLFFINKPLFLQKS
jgi:hypothetical protein